MDIDHVAAELSRLPPDEFTAARDARAKAAKAGGDAALAAAIKKLRRPTTGAWAANLVAHERPEPVGELLALGEAMRAAQATLSGPELRTLAKERQRVVERLVAESAALAERAGRPLSDAVRQELFATFEAAVADPGTAAALRAGRLTTSLSYSGFGGLDLSPAAAATTVERRRPPEQHPGAGERASATRATPSDARRDAARAVAEAQKRADAAGRHRQRAEHQLAERRRARTDGEARLAELRRAEVEALAAVKSAGQEADTAAQALLDAQKRLHDLRSE